ncbi:MAG: DUF2585 family protein [Sphingomicrobium sp.]
MIRTVRHLRPLWPALAILIAAGAVLLAMGRSLICPCGRVALWGPVGPTQSQMLADWYSFSHIVHGLLFYAVLSRAVPRWSASRRFVLALLVEAAWEILENTPMMIDRYREATIALGYTGDSVTNSMSDIAMMALGFLAARRLPVWGSGLLLVLLEVIPLVAIRDNLALNILMLVHPSDTIRTWQAGIGALF